MMNGQDVDIKSQCIRHQGLYMTIQLVTSHSVTASTVTNMYVSEHVLSTTNRGMQSNSPGQSQQHLLLRYILNMFTVTRPQSPEPTNTEFENTRVATLKAIEDNIIKCEFSQTEVKFIPDSAVSLIATHEAITRYFEKDCAIGNADEARIEQLVDMVYKDAQKIFLIAVRCKWPAVNVQSIVDVLEYKDAIVH
jgi:hypothetical protein